MQPTEYLLVNTLTDSSLRSAAVLERLQTLSAFRIYDR